MRRLMTDEGKVVLLTAPQKESVKLPSDSAIRDTLASAESTSVMPWSDTAATRELVQNKPQPAAITSRRELADVGVTVVKFANGVEAWLKPTTFKNDQINTSNHYTSQALTDERIAKLDRQKMLSFYKQRFSNAADFTLFMVGAFKVDEVLPLIAQYVGGLPSGGPARTQVNDVGIHFP